MPKREEDGVDWLKKPYFGEVPPYLTKIKQEIKDEYEYIKSMQEQQAMEGPSGMRLMGDDEISGLVVELKKKWEPGQQPLPRRPPSSRWPRSTPLVR